MNDRKGLPLISALKEKVENKPEQHDPPRSPPDPVDFAVMLQREPLAKVGRERAAFDVTDKGVAF